MRLTWKIRRKLIRILIFALLIIAISSIICTIYMSLENFSPLHSSTFKLPSKLQTTKNHFFTLSDMKILKSAIRENASLSTSKCTMETCFDISRCLSSFSVYVYPPSDKPSTMYKKFLKILRDSSYYTSDPNKACLLILSLDTLDRDFLSKDFSRKLPDKLKSLSTWNEGRNHLIFNLFSGSYPNYFDELDFPYGQAMLAKASFSIEKYRLGFDLSLPLLHHSHTERGKIRQSPRKSDGLFPIKRRYLLVFKGKRYLWGLGSETRNGLHHLNNGRDVLMLTTCKHGRFWDRHQDDRCSKDNELYNKYDYHQLIENSTFCLVPRGRRLGSFRFLESLAAGCIPVSLSNGLMLPFQEYIDWSHAMFSFDERQLFQVPHMLRHVSEDKILSMRLKTQFYWEEYFSSVEKVIHTVLEIIKSRIYGSNSYYIWNHFPGTLSASSTYSKHLHDFPFYTPQQLNSSTRFTAIILATRPAPLGNSPLVKLLKSLCNSTHLGKVIVSWVGSGSPKVMLPSQCTASIIIKDCRKTKKYLSKCLLPLSDIDTPAILSLWENTDLITEEIEFGLSTWLANSERLVGFTSQRHFWSHAHGRYKWSQVPNNRYSLVSLGAAFYHRYFGHYALNHISSTIKQIMDSSYNCFDVTFNFIISDLTSRPPLKVTRRTSLDHLSISSDDHKSLILTNSNCINSLNDAFGYMPLYYSWTRADPVLYKDNVSALRKEFRRLEIVE